jgi:hypothetical protein
LPKAAITMHNLKLSGPEQASIRQYLEKRFSQDDLEALAFDLDIDYQSLPHASKPKFVRELLSHVIRTEQLTDLLKVALEARPDPEVEASYQHLLDGQVAPNQKTILSTEVRKRLTKMLKDSSSFGQDRLASFVGRANELAEIKELIKSKSDTGGYITITGQAGQGKSSIIAKLVQEYRVEYTPAHFIPFNPGPDYQVSLLRDVMARLILKYNLSDIYVASESRQALRDFFFNLLKELSEQGQREVIFIDGLDQIEYDTNGYRDLTFLPERPPAGILFVLGTRPDDTLVPLELLNPSQQYKLPNLSRNDFDLILAHHKVTLDFELTNRFYTAMQE